MSQFLIDEDLPRCIATLAPLQGVDAVHVVDAGLRGQPDRNLMIEAVESQRTIVTTDREFGNILLFPPLSHMGVVLVRIPEFIGAERRVQRIVQSLVDLKVDTLKSAIVVIEIARTRIRRGIV